MYNEKKIEMLKQRYPAGTRICLDSMENDPNPIPSGTMGTVEFVDDMGTVFCKFDNGRSLGVILGEDSFHVVEQKQEIQREKPDCPLIGQDGNIFNLMGIVCRTLKENDMERDANEMCNKITHSSSYEEALNILGKYVNITSIDEELDECEEYEEELEEPDMGMNMSF